MAAVVIIVASRRRRKRMASMAGGVATDGGAGLRSLQYGGDLARNWRGDRLAS